MILVHELVLDYLWRRGMAMAKHYQLMNKEYTNYEVEVQVKYRTL